jgi:hypothetical protein
MSSQVLLCRVLTSICSLLFCGEISLCGNQKYPQRIVQRDVFLRKKKKIQKSPYFEEKISQKLSYLDIKFVEVAKTKQNSTLFFSTFLSDLCQIWLILLGMIADPKLDKNERKKTPELVAVFCELDNFYNLG